MASTILCGDIGGTNSRLRLFKVDADEQIDGANVPGELLFQKEYANETYARCAPAHAPPHHPPLPTIPTTPSTANLPVGLRSVCHRSQRRKASSGPRARRGTIHHPRALTVCARKSSPTAASCTNRACQRPPRSAAALDLHLLPSCTPGLVLH